MRTVTIDGKTWRRGDVNSGASKLINGFGNKCCLGFLGEACGIETERLTEIDYPRQTHDSRWPARLLKFVHYGRRHEEMEEYLARINDDMSTSDEERMKIITREFKKLGYAVQFINV